MKAATKALIPALGLVGALLLAPLAEANDGRGRGDSHRRYDSQGYSRSYGHGYARPYRYHSTPYRYYRPYSRGYYYAPPYYYAQPYPYGYAYDDYTYGPYPPPAYRGPRPRIGIGLYFGF